MTKHKFFAAAVALASVATLAPAAMALGPKPSSENLIAPDATVQALRVTPSGTMLGPKAASENFIAAQPTAPQAGQPHYVWQEGYEHQGKWRGHWVLVQ